MSEEPISTAVSQLKISENLNEQQIIQWDACKGIGVVCRATGSVWNTMGWSQRGTMHVVAEEALLLMEVMKYTIMDNDVAHTTIDPSALGSIFKITLTQYQIYRQLKSFGYVVFRPNNRYIQRPEIFNEPGRAEYSVYKPNSNFKKTEPSGYIGHVIQVKATDELSELVLRLKKADGKVLLCFGDGDSEFHFLEANQTALLPSTFKSDTSLDGLGK